MVLLALHIALWPYREQISKPEAYIIGLGTVGGAVTMIAALLGDWRIAIVFWAVAGAGGVSVGGAYLYRALSTIRDHRRATAQRIITRAEEQLRVSSEPDDRRN